jgi:PAS domain S-box-containing protein
MFNNRLSFLIPKSLQSGLRLTAVVTTICFAIIIPIYPRYGTELMPLVLVPMLISAWALPWRAAAVSILGLLAITFLTNTVMASVAVALQQLFSVGALISLFSTAIVGMMRILIIRSTQQSAVLAEERAALQREVTERQLTEQALRESEARYRAIVQDQTELICRFHPGGILTFVNDAYCVYFDRQRDQLLGFSFMPLVPAEDQPLLDEAYAAISPDRPTVSTEHRIIKADGEIRWMHWIDRAFYNESGDLVEFQAVGRDITLQKMAEAEVKRLNTDLERRVNLRTEELAAAIAELRKEVAERQQAEADLRESQQRLQLALNAAKAGAWAWNTNTNQLIWSDENYLVMGFQPGSRKPDYDLWMACVDPEDRPDASEQIAEAVRNRSGLDMEVRVIWPDGSIHWLNTLGQTALDENGQAEGMYGIQMDITERKRIEAEIRASLQEKEVLLQEIHHRVKNNLQVIASMLNLQSTTLADDQAQSALQESQNRVAAMATIHEKLYQSQNLARIDFGDYIRDLTAQLLSGYKGSAHNTLLDIVADDIWLDVNTAVPCGLILNELVSNALKHAFPHRQPDSRITVQFHHVAGNRVCLCVTDNGVGIPAHVNFQQTNSLGLQLLHTLTKQIGGSLEIENREGTIFKVTFPAPHKGTNQ